MQQIIPKEDGHAVAAGLREVPDSFGGTACALCAYTLPAQNGHAVAAGFSLVPDSFGGTACALCAPGVSIILVTYNRAQALPQTLDSIRRQTYQAFELLICDDCSTDSTAEICARYAQEDQRIRYVRNSSNLRMPGNLNEGIKRARCELIAVMHDGDIYDPATIERWRAAMLENPTAGFVFNVYRHMEADGVSSRLTDRYPEFMSGGYFLEELCFGDREMECPVWGTVMVRRRVLREMNLLNSRYGFWADMDLYFRIAEKYDVVFVPEPLIDLPHRQVLPHLFRSDALTVHFTIFKIYWEARIRHYRKRPRALAAALAGQGLDFLFSKSRRVSRRLCSAVTARLDRVEKWQQKQSRSARWIARILAR